MKMKKDIECVFGGMLLGMILGMMFAPKSGKKMRKDIKDMCLEMDKDFKNNVKEAYKELDNMNNKLFDEDSLKLIDKIDIDNNKKRKKENE